MDIQSLRGDAADPELIRRKFEGLPADKRKEILDYLRSKVANRHQEDTREDQASKFQEVDHSPPVTILRQGPDERAFSIPLVVKNIIQYLDFSNMKNFRLINESWNEVCSAHILQENLAPVQFTYNNQLKGYFLVEKESHVVANAKQVTDLIDLLQSPLQKFPSSDFTFTGFGGGDLTAAELRSLFTLQGPKMKTLRIISGNDGKNMWHILAEFDLLAFTPNLQSVHGFKTRFIDYFLKSNKLHTIKDYKLENVWPKINHLIDFSIAGPMLEKFEMNIKLDPSILNQTFRVAVSRILKTSQNSLTTLRLNVRSLFSELAIPPLTSLKHMILDLTDRQWYISNFTWVPYGTGWRCPYSKKFNLTQAFRSVTSVTIHYEPCSGIRCQAECWQDSLPPPFALIGSLLNVTTLRLCQPSTNPSFEFYKTYFPNVKKFIVEYDTFHLVENIVRTYPKLEELEFLGLATIDQDAAYDVLSNFLAIWGKSGELLKLVRIGGPLPPLADVKESKSIVDFKYLKKLKLTCDTDSLYVMFDAKNSLSELVRAYGFAHMPNVELTITYHRLGFP